MREPTGTKKAQKRAEPESREGDSALAKRRHRRRETGTASASSDTYKLIVEAAAHVFNEVGYEAASLDEIAKRIGLNRASMYYYVSTKAELLADVLRPAAENFSDSIPPVLGMSGSATAKLRTIVKLHHQIWEENYPGLMLLVQRNLQVQEPSVLDMATAATKIFRDAIEEILSEGIKSGEFREDIDIHLFQRIILALLNSSRDWWRPDGQATLMQVADVYADIVIRAVAKA